MHNKFCDVHGVDNVQLRLDLEKRGIRVLQLEKEYGARPTSDESGPGCRRSWRGSGDGHASTVSVPASSTGSVGLFGIVDNLRQS